MITFYLHSAIKSEDTEALKEQDVSNAGMSKVQMN